MALILVVDDSPSELFVLQKMLEKHDHQVITAENGELALELAKSRHPSLILMDVVMPNMNGFQTTRQLSKDPSTSNIPIIIVSSKDQDTDKLWGLRQGAKSYLSKPIEEDLLIYEVNKFLGSEQ